MSQPFDLCNDFNQLNVHERMNYVLGQVLGVKEFQQEQAYFLHKSRLQNRSLHGYGTVWGLEVKTQGNDETLEIQVEPGLAIDPQGREIHIDAAQCAQLRQRVNAWLIEPSLEDKNQKNYETLQSFDTKISEVLAVYVTLCYRPCETGEQRILGDPCRPDKDTRKPTRTRDVFDLKLVAKRPKQHEEDQVRAIGDLLAKLDIDPGAVALADAEFDALVRRLCQAIDDPGSISGLLQPDELNGIVIPASQSRDALRELFRHWVTNSRPKLNEIYDPLFRVFARVSIDPLHADLTDSKIQEIQNALDRYLLTNDLGEIDALVVQVRDSQSETLRQTIQKYWGKTAKKYQQKEDDCILLAALQFHLTANHEVDEATLSIKQLQRPYLLHTRLIQELALQAFIQNSIDELALDSGTARYSAPTEADADLPGVFPVEPMPDGVNVAFDVVVPNPTLGNGTARFAEGEETTGVFPVSPLPEGATVAFDVVMPEPPAPDLTLGEGTVSVEGTLGAGRRASGVYPAAGALPSEIAFDVVLPRAPELQQIPQIILRPVDMILSLAPGQERIPLPEPNSEIFLTPATLTNVNGYPALAFDVNNRERQDVAAFSTLRPPQVDPRQPPILRLYCTAEAGAVSWRVTWRWLRSLQPGEGFRPDAQLIPDGFQSADIESFDLTQFYLHRSPSLTLEVNAEEPDYLMVYLVPNAEVAEENPNLYLLMAELRWEVTQ
jgi:hypothetical protein